MINLIYQYVTYPKRPNDNSPQSKWYLCVAKTLDYKNLWNSIPKCRHRHESKPWPVSMCLVWCHAYKPIDAGNFHFQCNVVIPNQLGKRSSHLDQNAGWLFHWTAQTVADPMEFSLVLESLCIRLRHISRQLS